MAFFKSSRFFEILPGALAWLTIILMFVGSWYLPVWAAVFIILFDLYWLLKTIYLSLHLRSSFSKMRATMKINWRARLDQDARTRDTWHELYHLIILPMYNEPHAVVRETFQQLAATNYSLDKFIIVLALEERAGEEAQKTARVIGDEFGKTFFKFLVTTHPAGVAGEIPGKGSNEAWAAQKVKEEIIDPLGIAYEKVIASVFDIDTQVFPEYFGLLSHSFLTADKPLRSTFQPVALFTNNIFDAPALARVISFSSTFWQLTQQSRPEKLRSFSSHSMSFAPLVEIGFWHRDVVSEDSRIFWQCWVHFKGDWQTVPLFYPLSMDSNVAPTFWGTMVNLYKQQRRWGWGAENISYVFPAMIGNKAIALRDKLTRGFDLLEGFHSWATNSLIIFALGWLPIILGGQVFRSSLLAYNLPEITRWIMNLAMIGIATSATLSIMLLPPRPLHFKRFQYVVYFLSWVLIPITLIVFGSFAALEAQTRLMLSGKYRLDFWVTPKHRKTGRT
ncbi:MAG: hypothetical protein WC246_01905 [Candidatus Paceibacterota bacterium]|jgi:cellulose synthase/poly-beta-1,6-N-acetylglucosamine synthase-like glycosyltransferase